jgi:hypothetical protein
MIVEIKMISINTTKITPKNRSELVFFGCMDRKRPVLGGPVRSPQYLGRSWTGCGPRLRVLGAKNRTEPDLKTLVKRGRSLREAIHWERLFVERLFIEGGLLLSKTIHQGRRPFVKPSGREAIHRERGEPFVEGGRVERGCLLREAVLWERLFVEGGGHSLREGGDCSLRKASPLLMGSKNQARTIKIAWCWSLNELQ